MKILSASVQNFASYKELTFDFQNQGLTLIAGPTGSGKSTLCDVIPWICFGKTAKGGSVDEILSWPGDEITTGSIDIEDKSGYPVTSLRVTRIRGSKPKDNDLYYTIVGFGGEQVRGRDLNDTQRLINQLVGMDYDLYLAAAYFHEFSQTAQFFTTTAKNRRAICEQIVDLTLAKKLQARCLDEYKTKSKELQTLQVQVKTIENTVHTLETVQDMENNKAKYWESDNEKLKQATVSRYEAFEAGRKRTISKACPTCRTVLVKPQTTIDNSVNPYISRLEELSAAVNPHTGSANDYSNEIGQKKLEAAILTGKIADVQRVVDDIELLQQVTNDYRSVTIANSIAGIEDNTNKLLTDHFDAEIRVEFDIADADKLDVTIYKDGNLASFTQLSKGQRCLLKLCFGISVMTAVQNHNGLNVSQIFLDEALDGLDDVMKTKAYGLLETLTQSYETIMVVEHSEALKACFPNSYSVQLVNGSSQIEKV